MISFYVYSVAEYIDQQTPFKQKYIQERNSSYRDRPQDFEFLKGNEKYLLTESSN